ncbi:MAG: methyltransferase domain-containing protein [Calditrichota bacterium]
MKEVLSTLFGDLDKLKASGFGIDEANGIFSVLKPEFALKIVDLEKALKQSRSDYTRHFIENPSLFSELPYGSGSELHSGWTTRQLDLEIINELMVQNNPQHILEVGSWNGWLSQHLARNGRQLTTIDYFQDDYDGLGAKQHYPENWTAVQMDLADLSILIQRFDLIIANHCLGFMRNPAEWIRQLTAKLQPGGILIATGLMFYHNPQQKAHEVERSCRDFKRKYSVEMFLHPAKGYLDSTDKQQLIETGMQFKHYPEQSVFRKLLNFLPGRQRMEWGILTRD